MVFEESPITWKAMHLSANRKSQYSAWSNLTTKLQMQVTLQIQAVYRCKHVCWE